jgi:hypothetical protein
VLPPSATFYMSNVIDDANDFMGPTGTPMVTSNIVLEANGSTLWHLPNGTYYRAFAIASGGTLDIRNAEIVGFSVKGGDGADGGGGGMGAGGAIYVAGGTLIVESSTFEVNGALGGNGSTQDFAAENGVRPVPRHSTAT